MAKSAFITAVHHVLPGSEFPQSGPSRADNYQYLYVTQTGPQLLPLVTHTFLSTCGQSLLITSRGTAAPPHQQCARANGCIPVTSIKPKSPGGLNEIAQPLVINTLISAQLHQVQAAVQPEGLSHHVERPPDRAGMVTVDCTCQDGLALLHD